MTEGTAEFVRKLRNVIKGLMWLWTFIMGALLIYSLATGIGIDFVGYLWFGFFLWILPMGVTRIALYLMPGGKRKGAVPVQDESAPDAANPSPQSNSYLKREFVDVKARDQLGMTALMAVAHTGNHPEEIIALLKAGADLNAQDANGRTVLMHAAGYNANAEMVNTLIRVGADLKATDHDGMTSLMHATRYGSNPEVITALLKAGADPKAKDSEGKTAFEYAQHNGYMKAWDGFADVYRQLQEASQ